MVWCLLIGKRGEAAKGHFPALNIANAVKDYALTSDVLHIVERMTALICALGFDICFIHQPLLKISA